ncbi:MAG: hypothetical protein ABIZ18_00705 [Caldimonas sp.]
MNTAVLAAAVSAALFSATAFAKTAPAPVVPTTVIILPEQVVVRPTEWIGSSEPGPQTAAAARQEAAAVFAAARTDCRQEGTADARSSCLAEARKAHDRALEGAHQVER